ncbi:MAG: DUF1841 family protein [Planctomycetota bacterium]
MSFDDLMQQQFRQWVHELWAKRNLERPDQGPEATFLRLLEEHPEYHDIWSLPTPPTDPTIGGTNPYLHISLHQAVDEQLHSGEPAEVRDTFVRLKKLGDHEHEARHRIMGVLVTVMNASMQKGVAFDTADYEKRLRALG